jgi:hypothetical protein
MQITKLKYILLLKVSNVLKNLLCYLDETLKESNRFSFLQLNNKKHKNISINRGFY